MKNQYIWTAIISVLIIALVSLTFLIPDIQKINSLANINFPLLNAQLNSLSFISLILALMAIKKKNIIWHKRFILSALIFTGFFLISYLYYHFTTPPTKFGGKGLIKIIYLFILLTHIVLAAINVPLVLLTVYRGLKKDHPGHKAIAKWTAPVWLYVSFTGVLVYLLNSPYY